jgi:uncharacterized protein YndB with AHSA1/START domain
MIRQESSIAVQRAPLEVWEFLADPRNVPKWDPGTLAARLTSEGAPTVGTTYEVDLQLLGRRFSAFGRVLEADPGRKLAYTTSMPMAEVFARYTLEPQAGGTKLTRYLEAEFKGIYRLFEVAISTSGRLGRRRDVPEELENVKRVLELEG